MSRRSLLVTLAIILVASCARDSSHSNAPLDMDPATCYAGAAFLDCPGPRDPALYCSHEQCTWISHGAAIKGFTFNASTNCTCDPPCVGEMTAVLTSFLGGRGTDPWTRERERNVTVSVGGVSPRSDHSISCTNCPDCSRGASPCLGELPLEATRKLPGTFIAVLRALRAMAGWKLEIEVDLREQTQPAGRVCRVPFTDAPECGADEKIECAKSGTINLSSTPTTESMDVALSVSVDFPDDSHIDAFIAQK